MKIHNWINPNSSEITPEELYISRRRFMGRAGALVAAVALTACAPKLTSTSPATGSGSDSGTPTGGNLHDELGNQVTDYKSIANYNNYYEFTTDKEGVAPLSAGFTTDPWTVEVGGLVNKPGKYGLEDILADFTQEERIYRLRCVEGWSMVIPWEGFSLAQLLKQVEPTSDAKYVVFETVYRPAEMPGQKSNFYPWPYQEGLRLDEAMNSLTTLATGMYGKQLLAQNGAPIRLVVPWKYGFKSIKSIVKITLSDSQPSTFWNDIAPDEYGFYSNVNPNRPHPRWSQDSERRIGELGRIKTLMLNGYEQEVSSLYQGMDLIKDY